MRKIQISQNHRELIESVIKESPKFKGNEELIDIFVEAIYKKSYLLIDAIKDMSRLRRHLLVICDSCLENVIKEKQKFDETRIYKQIKEKNNKEEIVSLRQDVLYDDEAETLPNTSQNSIVKLKEEVLKNEKYEHLEGLIDPIEFNPKKHASKDTIDKLLQIIKRIDSDYSTKKYLEIFTLRYIKKMNQNEIAKTIKISQVELSKRFVELVKLTREYSDHSD